MEWTESHRQEHSAGILPPSSSKAIGNETLIFQMATAFYYFANEGISILENAALLGVPFPVKIKDALEELKESKTAKRTDDGGE